MDDWSGAVDSRVDDGVASRGLPVTAKAEPVGLETGAWTATIAEEANANGGGPAPRDAFVLIAGAWTDEAAAACREFAGMLADEVRSRVRVTRVSPDCLGRLAAVLGTEPDVEAFDVMPRPPTSATPMGGAPFVWRDDGRPDWAAMWTSFCDLALYGGPPHRGEDSALAAPAADAVPAAGDAAMLTEIRRGIWETTGLFAEPATSGWVAVTCASRKMAAWLTAAIILENVEARCDEERLLLPIQASLTLTDQVKSLVTVVAKTTTTGKLTSRGTGTGKGFVSRQAPFLVGDDARIISA